MNDLKNYSSQGIRDFKGRVNRKISSVFVFKVCQFNEAMRGQENLGYSMKMIFPPLGGLRFFLRPEIL